jgi:hypothetical protein
MVVVVVVRIRFKCLLDLTFGCDLSQVIGQSANVMWGLN